MRIDDEPMSDYSTYPDTCEDPDDGLNAARGILNGLIISTVGVGVIMLVLLAFRYAPTLW